ncbi:proton-conducting transporter transmembrane domain-containing protein [Solirubrobacter soli]|uniref:proton-conducting transporter transmembrane domain-containing protein n=1 Tax=Solirubrobacter soli TaxID=363832 RepID=UPI0004233E5D|nr:proton-conducting transporter membrane subunit [Solirubrobacter soli]
MGVVALTGALVLALAGVVTALPGRLRGGLALQAAGIALLGAAGVGVLVDGGTVGAEWREGFSPALGLDPLSGFFLAVLAVTAVPALVFAGSYLRSRAAGALMAPFLLSLAGLLAARDVSTFLAFWELMTLVPAAAILVAHNDAPTRSAVQRYVAITHLGGAGVWIALLVLAAPGPLSAAATTVVAIAALIGFGTKAGLVPLHSWLPRAHPVAPAPFSALMSGVMVKVALYGLIRVELEWLGPAPRWLGFALLAGGVVSALGGVVWALLQQDLKRLLAYSTIENVGVIVTALGASVLIADPLWASLAFGAALLHTATHAVFKTLLFLGAGAIERATGTLDLDRLGGLARRMPWTAAAFAIGCASIAGVPPLSGFASEWLTLQSLAHLGFDGPVANGLAGAAALAAIAATAALALLCFVNVAGLTLLGAPHGSAAASGGALADGEAPLAMRGALVVLAAGCVVLGVAAPALIGVLAELAPGAPAHPTPTGTGSLPAPALAVVLVALTALLVRARGARRAAPAPTWACGQPVTAALRWTSAGFTKPIRLVLEALLRPRRALLVESAGGVVQRMRYERHLASPADRLLYRPAIRGALAGAAVARRLQTGNVRTYAAYLLALVLCLLALVRVGGLG